MRDLRSLQSDSKKEHGSERKAAEVRDKLNEAIKKTSQKKKKFVNAPERAQNNKIYWFFFNICVNNNFNIFITACIVANTILLASDQYPMLKSEEES